MIEELAKEKNLQIHQVMGRYYATNSEGRIAIADFVNPSVYRGYDLETFKEKVKEYKKWNYS